MKGSPHGHRNDYNICVGIDELAQGAADLPQGLQDVLSRYAHHTGMDYFCLDVVHDLNNYYIIDLNLTPHSGDEDEADAEGAYFLRLGMKHLSRSKQRRATA